jgi:heme oxygenase
VDGVLARLRAETRPAHDRLEAELDVLAQCRTDAAYASLLALLHGVHSRLEPALDAVAPAVLDDWPDRRKLHLLDQDLRQLGVDPASVPATAQLPSLSSPARTLGVLYVVEGATLGGAVIARAARPRPVRFLDAYGGRRGELWRAYRRQVQAWCEPNSHVDEVLAGAGDAFSAFTLWCGVPAAA